MPHPYEDPGPPMPATSGRPDRSYLDLTDGQLQCLAPACNRIMRRGDPDNCWRYGCPLLQFMGDAAPTHTETAAPPEEGTVDSVLEDAHELYMETFPLLRAETEPGEHIDLEALTADCIEAAEAWVMAALVYRERKGTEQS